MLNRVQQFLGNKDGPTATEYAVMLALIVVVAVTAISALGIKVSSIFSTVQSSVPVSS